MAWVLLAIVAAALVYEVYALANRQPGDTISEYVWLVTNDYPLLPFVLGMIAGHFFWGRRP